MKHSYLNYILLCAIVLIASCTAPNSDAESSSNEEASTDQADERKITGDVMEKNGIKVYGVLDSPEYPNAKLTLNSPKAGQTIQQRSTTFEFAVEDYELGVQTADAEQKNCANSGKGQHIHFIWNNSPYSAHYEPSFVKELDKGHHVMLAFLSRSYHESIKNPTAFIVQEFNVGGTDFEDDFDETAPHLFYSRPKGSYIGKQNMGRVMLDFYLLNVDLSPDGYKVRAEINGTPFVLTKWIPYFIEGLQEGENFITLSLLDANDQIVPGPYNEVKRKIIAAVDEPIPAN